MITRKSQFSSCLLPYLHQHPSITAATTTITATILASRRLPCSTPPSTAIRRRHLHARLTSRQPPIPEPTPFVPDPSTFLTLIGRNLSTHAAKFPTWASLFSLTSTQLRDLGVEPARTRRYLLWWRDRYRKGVFGVGGDLLHVKDGEAEVRVVEVPAAAAAAATTVTTTMARETEEKKEDKKENRRRKDEEELLPRMRRMVVNKPLEIGGEKEGDSTTIEASGVKPVEGMKVKGARQIVGPFVQPVKGTSGSVARIKVQEGMWEVKRGEKIDGGERRKKMVRRKRVLEERKTGRK